MQFQRMKINVNIITDTSTCEKYVTKDSIQKKCQPMVIVVTRYL